MGIVYVVSLVVSVSLALLVRLHGLLFALAAILGSVSGFVVWYTIIGLIRPAKVELRPPTDLPVRFPDRPREESAARQRSE
jgi:hypothetical protein